MARILVIDDEPHLQVIIQNILRRDGHLVDVANNGATGLLLMEVESYDLVITDIVMPDTDGFEVLMAMISKYPRTKKIVISGGGSRLDLDLLLATARYLHANRVIAKPIDYENFASVVTEVLSAKIDDIPPDEQQQPL